MRYAIDATGEIGSWSCNSSNKIDFKKDEPKLQPQENTQPTVKPVPQPPAGTNANVNSNTYASAGTCSDGFDNNRDGTIDWNGGTINGKPVPADPSCISATSNETADNVATGSLIPCTNNCDLNSAMQLINNLITFLIKVVLFPIAILMFVYAGYTYITSQGNPSKRADVKKLIKHLILGMVLILAAWLIVKTLLVTIGYTDTLYFFD